MNYDTKYILAKFNKSKPGATDIGDIEKKLSEYICDPKNNEESLNAFSELRLKLSSYFNLDAISLVTGNGTSIYAGSRDTRGFSLAAYTGKEKYKSIKSETDHISDKDIETALNKLIILYEQKKIIEDSVSLSSYQALINEVKSALIDSFVSLDYSNLSSHEILLRKLRAFGCLNKVNIFTANYDLAFEYAFDNLGIEYNDGFTGFVSRKFAPKTLEKKGLPILNKFHGSVNWISDNDEILEEQPKFSYVDTVLGVEKTIRELKININKDNEKVLIYPTANKLYQTYSAPYSELMRFMLDRFESGKNLIIVIGYKYGDDHINEILSKALANPDNVFYFYDFDNDEKASFINNMKKLAEITPNVNVLSGKILADFTNFAKFEVPATAEKTDEEKIVELLHKVMG